MELERHTKKKNVKQNIEALNQKHIPDLCTYNGITFVPVLSMTGLLLHKLHIK